MASKHQELHKKLKARGVTEEDLETMTSGVILCIPCPHCQTNIFYTLTGEYYEEYLQGKQPSMLLYCRGCEDYQTDLNLLHGEILYEKKGKPELRKTIPFVERISSLPKSNKE